MSKYFKTKDHKLYMAVDEKSDALFKSKSIDLFAIWTKADTIYRLPLVSKEEYEYAKSHEHISICIELGETHEILKAIRLEQQKEEFGNAPKLLYEGFIYVRYSDLAGH